jgi:hypothetical protein
MAKERATLATTRANFVLPTASRLAEAFTGAPLDLIKVAAALSMVVDHTSKILFGFKSTTCWYIGRAAFPLFVFAIAVHLLRGAEPWRYMQRLALLAVVSQPTYAIAFGTTEPDTVFTLAICVAVAALAYSQSALVRHLALAATIAAIFAPQLQARTGLDFGLAGIALPAALVLALGAGRGYWAWLALVLLGLSIYPRTLFIYDLAALLSAAVGGSAIVILSLACRGRQRFLPRFAFYAFYPGHLLVLALLKDLQV